jgi:pimeloyl-ACP methyl ester carboxylesterase
MKKLKQIIAAIKSDTIPSPDELNNLLWQFICYSPKMPVRLQQEQLLNESEKFSLRVSDDDFAKRELNFNGFKWGQGKYKVLITHGWGSKAADFYELISKLSELKDLTIIAFDAPGNGSSEGELSNLLLFKSAVKAIIAEFGTPDVMIGHSLGGMANMMVLTELEISPVLLISISPLIRLKENFEYSMDLIGISADAQNRFLESFTEKFNVPASGYNLIDGYRANDKINHLLIYDKNDPISTYDFLSEFLDNNPSINSQDYEGAGHERIIKSEQVVNNMINAIKIALAI